MSATEPSAVTGFLGKPWFKSLTVWGAILYFGLADMFAAACEQQILSEGICSVGMLVSEKVGSLLIVFGVRRHKQA